MKVKVLYGLLVSLFLLNCQVSVANDFLDSKRYLVDSLESSKFTKVEMNYMDSCVDVFHSTQEDSTKIKAVLDWDSQIYIAHPKLDFQLNEFVVGFCERKLNDDLKPKELRFYQGKLGTALNNMGEAQRIVGKYEEALVLYERSLKQREELGNRKGMAMAYNNMGLIYQNQSNYYVSLENFIKALDLHEENGDPYYISSCNNNIGMIYFQLGQYDSSLVYYEKSQLLSSESEDLEGGAYAFVNIGLVQQKKGDTQFGLAAFFQALGIFEKIANKDGIAFCYRYLGILMKEQGSFEEALDYFTKSFEIREQMGDLREMANCQMSLGYIQGDLGKAELGQEYFKRSLEIYEKIGDKQGVSSAFTNLGVGYSDLGDTLNAMLYYKKSLQIDQEIGDKDGEAVALGNISGRLLDLGQISEATIYAKRSLEIGRQIGSAKRIRFAAGLLSLIFKEEKNFKEALEMYELHIKMRDSIKNDETQKAVIRQQTKYEFEREQLVKEQNVKEQVRLNAEVTSRRDNLQYSVILIALLVLFGGVLALGSVNISVRMAEGIIFFSFLILFEFLLVLADPYIEGWSGGAPGVKLLFNALLAGFIFPLHSFFESRMKGRLVKNQN